MPPETPLSEFKSILSGRADAPKKAAIITALAHRLPEAALPVMDQYLDDADLLVQVAIMDAYFEMTGDDYHEEDLVAILDKAARKGNEGEELFLAARLALGRVRQEPLDAFKDVGIEIVATRTRGSGPPGRSRSRRIRRPGAAPSTRPSVGADSITVIIHGTWATNGTWWRPRGDFYEYVKKDLRRADLYGGRDQFRWAGDNSDTVRRQAAVALRDWLAEHPAARVNVFAHSHGANVAMMATKAGANLDRLVMLSPPVRKDYFANWRRVGAAFNIQANFDPVVGIARGGQSFARAGAPRGVVKEKVLRANGHSASHEPKVWRKEKLASFVGIPWA